jgi:hypothetical protein
MRGTHLTELFECLVEVILILWRFVAVLSHPGAAEGITEWTTAVLWRDTHERRLPGRDEGVTVCCSRQCGRSGFYKHY